MKSKKGSKQRKKLFESKLHERNKIMSARLSDELTKKYKIRNVPVRKGDKVKIMRGKYKKVTGKINKVNTKRMMVFIDGADRGKIDGSKSFYPLHPSKLMILELNLDDKKRLKQINKKE
jgi:large subunit ribosomal protein L24